MQNWRGRDLRSVFPWKKGTYWTDFFTGKGNLVGLKGHNSVKDRGSSDSSGPGVNCCVEMAKSINPDQTAPSGAG